jgi:hypothetical protein
MDPMRVEELSDHAGDQRRATTRQRNLDLADRDGWEIRREEAQAEWDAARRAQPVWRRVLRVSSSDVRAAQERVTEAAVQAARADGLSRALIDREQSQTAGVDGERRLETELAALSDDWLMLRGYRNRRGETDCVLVGPGGVWAVEVKNRNAVLRVVDDDWSFEKLDNRGRVVNSGPATDGSGRTWARQVADVADDLTRWLESRSHAVEVHTAVMLVHHKARIAQCVRPGVDLVATDVAKLRHQLTRPGTVLSPEDCHAIGDLVGRDHRFHEKNRRRGH